jgi:hypothetical protein
MTSDPNALRSRRAILAAAAGSAAAVAASAALPLGVAAAPVNMQTEQDNPSAAETSITLTDPAVDPTLDPQVAFKSVNTLTAAAAVVALIGDQTNASSDTSFTGAYAFAPNNPSPDFVSAGVWGDSEDWGVYGSGGVGVFGDGFYGVVGRAVDGGGAGVLAIGLTDNTVALDVQGKVKFSRSSRVSIGTGKSSVKVTKAGVTSSSRIFAVLASNRSGRYVRAVVPTTGSFTIYLNTTLTSAAFVNYFIIN